jgi:hypothetical protein
MRGRESSGANPAKRDGRYKVNDNGKNARLKKSGGRDKFKNRDKAKSKAGAASSASTSNTESIGAAKIAEHSLGAVPRKPRRTGKIDHLRRAGLCYQHRYSTQRLKSREALVPPKPKEFDSA